jgi:hypothetical protein
MTGAALSEEARVPVTLQTFNWPDQFVFQKTLKTAKKRPLVAGVAVPEKPGTAQGAAAITSATAAVSFLA